MFPEQLSAECEGKFIPCTGNNKFLKSVIYNFKNFPLRILLKVDEGFIGLVVVYVSEKNLICIDSSSSGDYFESQIKIPLTTLRDKVFNGVPYELYINEKCLEG